MLITPSVVAHCVCVCVCVAVCVRMCVYVYIFGDAVHLAWRTPWAYVYYIVIHYCATTTHWSMVTRLNININFFATLVHTFVLTCKIKYAEKEYSCREKYVGLLFNTADTVRYTKYTLTLWGSTHWIREHGQSGNAIHRSGRHSHLFKMTQNTQNTSGQMSAYAFVYLASLFKPLPFSSSVRIESLCSLCQSVRSKMGVVLDTEVPLTHDAFAQVLRSLDRSDRDSSFL